MIQNFVIESHELLIFCSPTLAPHSNIHSTIAGALATSPSSHSSTLYPQADVPCVAWKLNFVSLLFFRATQSTSKCDWTHRGWRAKLPGLGVEIRNPQPLSPPLLAIGNRPVNARPGADASVPPECIFWNARQLAKLAVSVFVLVLALVLALVVFLFSFPFPLLFQWLALLLVPCRLSVFNSVCFGQNIAIGSRGHRLGFR